MSGLVEELNAQRAEERIGETVEVLVESIDGDVAEGRGAHQGPEVDGTTTLEGIADGTRVGDLVRALVHGTDGVDLQPDRSERPDDHRAAGEQRQPPNALTTLRIVMVPFFGYACSSTAATRCCGVASRSCRSCWR